MTPATHNTTPPHMARPMSRVNSKPGMRGNNPVTNTTPMSASTSRLIPTAPRRSRSHINIAITSGIHSMK